MNTYAVRFIGMVVIVVLALATAARADAPTGRYREASGTVYDTKTKLTWQQAVPVTTYTWADAKTYCAGVGSTLGGAGWRLPTRHELLTIVDYSRTNPAIDPIAFPPLPPNFSYPYHFWSASPLADPSEDDAWSVNFSNGYSYYEWVINTYNVRCVR